MEKMGWQKHTVRGFMAGAMKKAGYTVESFKPEGGERTYRINRSINIPSPSARPASAAAGFSAFVPDSPSRRGSCRLVEHTGQPPAARTWAACGETVANPCAACNSRSSPDQSERQGTAPRCPGVRPEAAL
jgi:hypothetical protein